MTTSRGSERCGGRRAGRCALVALWVALVAGPGELRAQASVDTLPPAAADTLGEGPFFTAGDAWLALGFAGATVALAPLDQRLARTLQDSTLQAHEVMRHLADGLRLMGFPGTLVLGGSLWALGHVADRPRLAEVGLRGGEAVVVSYAFVWLGKNVLGRARPTTELDRPLDFRLGRGFREGSDYRSFPSGHTASGFAFAAAVSEEVRHHWPHAARWASPAVYAGALLMGISRMYHNRHWASDVVIGAGVGTFSGLKVVQYHHRNPAGRLDRWLLPRVLLPTEEGMRVIWSVPVP